ncbi:hypothetical protein BGW38_009398 [Lunasporangiospora selenospora]|uniref:Glutathione S-transferase n=1 Tax=Lunasporangiospora selenospora TaxID=979761 RepID=A0A9P6G256_9FUNG|nr:hypothetical protein BGW38_009398 [Lunasporangiospora selenospora]
MTKVYRSFHTEGQSNEENSRILNATKDVEYEIMYFDITCMAATARTILALSNTKWTERNPVDWTDVEEYDCPFGVMPLLKIKTPEGEAFVAETLTIDLFLAEKYNLVGSNKYEEQTIKAFYSSIHYLRERSITKVTWTFADKRKQGFETFMTKQLPWWIKIQEQHLEKNGANGHFFGDKLSLADIHFQCVLDHFGDLPRGEEILDVFRASPLLWKVYETTKAVPEIAAYHNSEAYNKTRKGGNKLYSVTAFEN